MSNRVANQIRCPECGGDATRTRDRFPFTTHGSRAYLWIIFGVLAGGYIVTILLMSNFSRYTTIAIPNAGEQTAVYTPAVDAGSVYLREVRSAIVGDDEMLARVREELRSALDGENEFDVVVDTQRVRLEVHNTQATINTMQGYSAFGRHVSRSHTSEVSDPRTRTRVQRATPTGGGITSLRWWPGFHVQFQRAASDRSTFSISYLGVLGYITLLVLLSWCVSRSAPKRFGRGYLQAFVLILFVMGSVVSALMTIESRAYNTNIYPLAESEGAWFEADPVRLALDDDDALRAVLEEMSAGLETLGSSPRAVLIAREYLNPSPDPTMPEVLESSWRGWWLMRQGSAGMFTIGTTSYSSDRTPEQLKDAPRTAFWDYFYRWGRARFEIHRPSASTAYDINVLNLALLLGMVWWIWFAVSRIHRFRTRRAQRKRVNRGECIYCGYRASDEALAARWEVSPPPP